METSNDQLHCSVSLQSHFGIKLPINYFLLTSVWPHERNVNTTCLRYEITISRCPSLKDGSSNDMSPVRSEGMGFTSLPTPFKEGEVSYSVDL